MNTPSPLRKLGGGIRARREAAEMALADLARAAATNEETLAAIEAGRRDPEYLTLARLARALGVSVGTLLAAMDEDEA